MNFFDTDGLAGKDGTEINLFVAETDAAAIGDDDGLVVEGIVDVGQSGTVDGSTVDLMNPEAVGKFIELYYEEFYRRHGKYFGTTMPATFADHEGSYGGKLAWTPHLFETFRLRKRYDLEQFLPGLTTTSAPEAKKYGVITWMW